MNWIDSRQVGRSGAITLALTILMSINALPSHAFTASLPNVVIAPTAVEDVPLDMEPVALPTDQKGGMPTDQKGFLPTDQKGFLPTDQKGFLPTDQKGFLPTDQKEFMPTDQKGFLPTDQKGFLPTDQKGIMPTDQKGFLPTDQKGFLPTDQKGAMSWGMNTPGATNASSWGMTTPGATNASSWGMTTAGGAGSHNSSINFTNQALGNQVTGKSAGGNTPFVPTNLTGGHNTVNVNGSAPVLLLPAVRQASGR